MQWKNNKNRDISSRFMLLHSAYLLERPNSENNFANDLFLGYAAQGAAAGIYGFGPVVAHDKICHIRNLTGQFPVALAQGFFRKIRFLQSHAVYIHIACLINMYPATGSSDDPPDHDPVVVVKGYHITGKVII